MQRSIQGSDSNGITPKYRTDYFMVRCIATKTLSVRMVYLIEMYDIYGKLIHISASVARPDEDYYSSLSADEKTITMTPMY